MKIEQFKKAAKRLASNEKIQLSEAQEKLSTYFGFKNFFAASKCLDSKCASEDERLEVSDLNAPLVIVKENNFWCDLNITEFKLLIIFLRKRNNLTEDFSQAKSIRMFDAVIESLSKFENSHDLKCIDIYEAIQLEYIEKIYVECWIKFKIKDRRADWPDHVKKITRYLESDFTCFMTNRLIKEKGYDVDYIDEAMLLNFKPGNSGSYEPGAYCDPDLSARKDHTESVKRVKAQILEMLEIFEKAGGLGQVKFSDHEKGTLKDYIKIFCHEKKLPEDKDYIVFNTCFKSALKNIEQDNFYN